MTTAQVNMAGSRARATGRTSSREKTVAPREASKPDKKTFRGRFALRLRDLRAKAGLTVDQVRDAIRSDGHEISLPTLYAWERGSRTPAIEDLPMLAKALKLSDVGDLIPPK